MGRTRLEIFTRASFVNIECYHSRGKKLAQKINLEGGLHSSLVLSVPTILRSWVRIRSTPSMLFPICIIEIVMREEQKETRRGRDWPILKKYQFWWTVRPVVDSITKFQHCITKHSYWLKLVTRLANSNVSVWFQCRKRNWACFADVSLWHQLLIW